MFERNMVDTNPEKGTVSAEVSLDDGVTLSGRFFIPISKGIYDILNGPDGFVEFEPFEGERQLLSKKSLRTVKLISAPRAENLGQRVHNLDGFEPHGILGTRANDDWETVREAYLVMSKRYHPDRYASADLPREVSDYLSAMSRRVNAAYKALETQRAAVAQRKAAVRAAPIYESRVR